MFRCAISVLVVAFVALLSTPPRLDLRPPDPQSGTIDAPPSKRSEALCTRTEAFGARVAPPPFVRELPGPSDIAKRTAVTAPSTVVAFESWSRRTWLADQREAIKRVRPQKLPQASESSAA